jgi:hypothetical protein
MTIDRSKIAAPSSVTAESLMVDCIVQVFLEDDAVALDAYYLRGRVGKLLNRTNKTMESPLADDVLSRLAVGGAITFDFPYTTVELTERGKRHVEARRRRLQEARSS